jgi:hypothetical protein
MAPLSEFTRVVLFCPPALTGGPEAIHQLAHALNSQGVDAFIVYSGPGHTAGLHDGRLVCANPAHAPSMAAYARYRPRVAAEIPLGPETLVVAPEPWLDLPGAFAPCGGAVWWLSVDNALPRHPQLADPAARRAALANRPLIHFHQSAYARTWLAEAGVHRLYPLGDYTSEEFTERPATGPAPRALAAFNPEKGGQAAEGFFSGLPQYEALALRGLTKAQLREVFAERLLYVDFGAFPGKDRMPREAAISGSVVFVRRAGAADNDEDYDLPSFYRFDAAEAASGELAARLAAVAGDPQGHWDQQAAFRAQILGEKRGFLEAVARLWGGPAPG